MKIEINIQDESVYRDSYDGKISFSDIRKDIDSALRKVDGIIWNYDVVDVTTEIKHYDDVVGTIAVKKDMQP